MTFGWLELPHFGVWEIAGVGAVLVAIGVIWYYDWWVRSAQRYMRNRGRIDQETWDTLHNGVTQLVLLLTGEHGLEPEAWETSVNENLGACQLALALLRPQLVTRNGVVRPRGRSTRRPVKKATPSSQIVE